MMGTYFTIAFFTGLANSFHCIGMCGPIAIALPVGGLSIFNLIAAKLLYNLGRVLTYSILGYVFGAFGGQFSSGGWQQGLSIFIGVNILFLVFFSKKHSGKFLTIFSRKVSQPITAMSRNLTKNKTKLNFLIFGILNGILPCGMLYIALASASASGNAVDGSIFMALFGLGTVPFMFSVNILPVFLSKNTRIKINNYLPIYSIFLVVYFIIRGMGLGIPYLSPSFEINEEKQKITVCHTTKIDK